MNAQVTNREGSHFCHEFLEYFFKGFYSLLHFWKVAGNCLATECGSIIVCRRACYGCTGRFDRFTDTALGVYFAAIGNLYMAYNTCLLYTSDAADERSSVDLGGRRIIKKKTNIEVCTHHHIDIK